MAFLGGVQKNEVGGMGLITVGVMILCASHCILNIVAACSVRQQCEYTYLQDLECLSCLGHGLRICRPSQWYQSLSSM